jgi:hypothetical protein
MRIALIVEGKTEGAFLPALRKYLEAFLPGKMPTIRAVTQNSMVPKEDKLKLLVENLLSGADPYDAVIALTDVYTSKNPATRDFTDAADAKQKMRQWAGNNPKFSPHAAQHDFEAWLLPYWATIQEMAGHNATKPSGSPENVNHDKSPAYHIIEIFRLGKKRDYNKPRDAKKILEKNDLSVAISQCPELKSFINTILTLCNHKPLP